MLMLSDDRSLEINQNKTVLFRLNLTSGFDSFGRAPKKTKKKNNRPFVKDRITMTARNIHLSPDSLVFLFFQKPTLPN